MTTYDETNFFENTDAVFTFCQKPTREPDYVSDSGSCYWYTDDGVIRGSDHWGSLVASCRWYFGCQFDIQSNYAHAQFDEMAYGFSAWKNFKNNYVDHRFTTIRSARFIELFVA